MKQEYNLDLWEQIGNHFKNQPENDEQAKICLSMGIAIYYTENNTPDNYVIKEYPNGKKQLITWLDNGKQEIIHDNY